MRHVWSLQKTRGNHKQYYALIIPTNNYHPNDSSKQIAPGTNQQIAEALQSKFF